MSYSPPLLFGPIAPESNPPINPQYFQPSDFFISALTFTNMNVTVTTSVNHNFVIGQLTRLLIPETYGSRQLNERTGFVISIPAANQVILNIVARNVDPFISSPAFGTTKPQIVPVGDVNSGQINSSGIKQTKTFIPGSFENISPL